MTDSELIDAMESHRVGVWPTTRTILLESGGTTEQHRWVAARNRERVSRPTLREAVLDLLVAQGLAKRERVA